MYQIFILIYWWIRHHIPFQPHLFILPSSWERFFFPLKPQNWRMTRKLREKKFWPWRGVIKKNTTTCRLFCLQVSHKILDMWFNLNKRKSSIRVPYGSTERNGILDVKKLLMKGFYIWFTFENLSCDLFTGNETRSIKDQDTPQRDEAPFLSKFYFLMAKIIFFLFA